MKIKSDFVTNSSSTSYVILSQVVAKAPPLADSYRFLREYYSSEFIYDNYAHFHVNRLEDGEAVFTRGEKSYEVDAVLKNTAEWGMHDQDVNPITTVDITLKNENPYDFESEDVMADFLHELFIEKLELKKFQPFQLVYTAFPIKISGDGWDGGDPQGPSEYSYLEDLYLNEAKMGFLNVINSRIIPSVGGVKDQVELNKDILRSINDLGMNPEEQNDKNC